VAGQSDSYAWPTLLGITLIGLILPGVSAPYIGIVSSGDLFFIQIVTLAVLGGILLIPRLRVALIPDAMKRAAGAARAREQFIERGLHLTQGRTGILIFVSVAERYVEILADDGINAKVDPATWQDIIDTLIDDIHRGRVAEGFRKVVASVGDILAEHVPAEGKNPNELPDRLFVI
jgi:putative membrane protein